MIWIWLMVGMGACNWGQDHPGHAALDFALAAGLVVTHKHKPKAKKATR